MITKTRLKNLQFDFIEEIHEGVYKKVNAKSIAETPNTRAHLVDDEKVCFWSDTGSDHACCINLKDILAD